MNGDKIYAHANYDLSGNFFCGTHIITEKTDFAIDVNRINGIYGSDQTPEQVSKEIVNPSLNEIGQHVHCLKQLQPDIDLNTVMRQDAVNVLHHMYPDWTDDYINSEIKDYGFRSSVWAGMKYAQEYNRENLVSEAPEFAKYVLNMKYCTSDNLHLIKNSFSTAVGRINDAVNSEIATGSMKSLHEMYYDLMTSTNTSGDIVLAGEMAQCLSENNMNPDDIAKFSSKAQEMLSYDMISLTHLSPELVQYTTVPEFGPLAGMIAATSIIGVIMISRKFNLRF
jgi:hypothetical protein